VCVAPTLLQYLTSQSGNSVLLHVTDFMHYLYIAAPVAFSPHDCDAFKTYLDAQIGNFQPTIQMVQMVMRENLYGFQGNQQNPYLKITVTDPKYIARVRSKIENGEANWKGMWKGADVLTFDMIQYILRFMVDCKVRMCFQI
jgi:DNA polymerase delta subunit 1